MKQSTPASVPRRPGLARLGVAVLLLVGAGVCALICRSQSVVRIPAERVRFSFINDVAWDPTSHRLVRTGTDPYLCVDLPDTALPIRHVTVEYGGAADPNEGHFYVFWSTSNPPHLGLTMQEGQVSALPGGLRIDADLPDSQFLRLDLPDFLVQPLELRDIVIATTFVSPWRWSFLGAVLGATAAVAVLLWWWLRGRRWGEWVVMGGLAAVKIWLAGDIGLTVFGNAMHDDALFITQARAIMDGNWLGPYNDVTLAKGPVYPLFLATVGWSGLPLQPAQAALHALACLIFVFALRPLVPRAGPRVLLFTVLLLDPQTLSAEAVERVLRVGIQPSLVLLALAGTFGLATRLSHGPSRVAMWGLAAGLAWAAFWYSREEGVWLVPSALLVLGVAGLRLWRGQTLGRHLRLAWLMAPLGGVLLANLALRGINLHYYGSPAAVEFTSGGFPAAYGALTRITPARYNRLVQAPRETRMRAYAVSPALAELQSSLEGEYGTGWIQYGWERSDTPEKERDIRPGWLPWALRGAAAGMGYYRDPATADRYWRRVALEINAACDQGRVAASGPRSGFRPQWHPALARPLWDSFRRGAAIVVCAADFRIWRKPTIATAEQVALFESVTHQTPAGPVDEHSVRSVVREVLFNCQSLAGWWATTAAAAAGLFVLVRAPGRRDRWLEAAVLLALVGGTIAVLLVIALIDVTSFSSLTAIYLAPAAPLVLSCWILAPYWALRHRPVQAATE